MPVFASLYTGSENNLFSTKLVVASVSEDPEIEARNSGLLRTSQRRHRSCHEESGYAR